MIASRTVADPIAILATGLRSVSSAALAFGTTALIGDRRTSNLDPNRVRVRLLE